MGRDGANLCKRMPLVVGRQGGDSLADYVRTNLHLLEEQLLRHGAVLFRGYGITTISAFDAVIGALGSSTRLDYVYRSTPRKALGDRIFTASEYPPSEEIPLHNENAYQRQWPSKLAFCCLQPAAQGGETTIADMLQVTALIDREVLNAFAARGVEYIRHYRPYIDLSWQSVFNVTDRSELEHYCAENDIACEWMNQETLRTSQKCHGVATHPQTSSRIFFNQAHLFHVSSLPESAATSLIETFGLSQLPRHARFGDAAEIPGDFLTNIRDAFAASSVDIKWESGDVLFLDNMLCAHGRRSYKGKRELLACLLGPTVSA
jgi:alpha-ketoglutarate-dependent taurine dioxygenase